MRINDKDVFLMSNSEPKLKGGYITPYAVEVIENYMLEYWNNKGLTILTNQLLTLTYNRHSQNNENY